MDTPCPGCGGPITFSPADPDGITVYFHCPDQSCIYGKEDGWIPPAKRAVVSSPVEAPASRDLEV